nr:line-1 reverse transcriptase like [Quercus suber]
MEEHLSHHSGEHQVEESPIGPPSLGLDAQSLVEFHNGCSTAIMGGGKSFEHVEKAISSASLRQIWMVKTGKETSGPEGNGITLMGNHPMLKLIQILALVEKCDVLICCREDVVGILKYMMIWKPKLKNSKDLLRRIGWNIPQFLNSLVAFFPKKSWIGREVSDEDVRNGLWGLKPFKALGPDGLHIGFYQHFWHDVWKSVCEEAKAIFKDGLVLEHANDTLVTLILKCQSPESLNNYRLISFCNLVYKTVSKILVERIRPYISKLVSPVQLAFVPGRKGMDNY